MQTLAKRQFEMTIQASESTVSERLGWIVYLFLSTVVGLLWVPFAFLLCADNYRSQPMVRFILVWVAFTCLLFAYLFRRLQPSNWFAAAFPLVGIVAYGLVSCGSGPRFAPDPFYAQSFFGTFLYAAICVHIVSIVPAYLYVRFLRVLHRRTVAWSAQAHVPHRHLATTAMALASLALVIGLRGALDQNRREVVGEASTQLELPISPRAEVLYQEYETWDKTGGALVWVRMPDRTSWPPRVNDPNRVPFDPGNKAIPLPMVPEREVTLKQKIDWTQDRRDYSATLYRTPSADYIHYESAYSGVTAE